MLTLIARAIRGLFRRPLYNSLLFLLLTLGATATGTIGVLVYATALRPMPFRDADRLYALSSLEPTGANRVTQFATSAIQLNRWRSVATAFDRMEAYTPTNPKLTGEGEPESLRGASVTAGLFDMIGAVPALGRSFQAGEDVPGSNVVILSDGYWRRRFGADPGIIGARLTIDDLPRTVIGVMRPSFTMFFFEADLWMPMALTPQQASSPTLRTQAVVGHLREGATVEQAVSQIRAANATLAAEFPRVHKSTQPNVVLLRQQLLGTQRATVLLLLGAVVFLFLIACANAMNLAFADAVSRRTATITRLALGSPRGAIAIHRVGETILVGIVSGLAAILLGPATLALLQAANPTAFAGMGTVAFGPGSMIATVAFCALAAAAIALPVAVNEAGGDVSELAGTLAKAIGNRADRRKRFALVTVQVAVTLMLLCGTAFLLRNVRALLAVSPGFEPSNLLVVPMTISNQTYPTPPEKANYVAQILANVRAIPGVKSASTTQSRFVLAETMNGPFDVQEVPNPNGESPMAGVRHTTPDLITTLGMRVIQGRAIAESDRIDGPQVAMINESFAKAYLPGVDPIGKHMRRANALNPGPWMEIVGVVNDVMDAGLGFPIGPAFYISYLQQNTPSARVTLLVRTTGEPVAQARAVREAIWSADRNQIIESISSMEDLLSNSAARPRFQALVTVFFAGVALVLALVGIYVVTLHDVLRLSREFGVRAALGAQTKDLIALAVRGALKPVAVGCAIGAVGVIPVVLWMSRTQGNAISSFSSGDAPAVVGMGAILLGGAIVVALVAARRVTRVDPAIAMRV